MAQQALPETADSRLLKGAEAGDLEACREALVNRALPGARDVRLLRLARQARLTHELFPQSATACTPLHFAARGGHLEVIQFLLSPASSGSAVDVNPLDKARTAEVRQD